MPVEQPTHAEQVSHRLEPAAAEPVFGLTEASRAMVNRDFDNAITGAFYERRHETMHSFEWNERRAALAPHRLECAPCVADAVTGVTAAHKIRDTTNDPLEQCVFAGPAVTANHVRAFCNFGEQSRNIGRIVLQIAVYHDNGCAARSLATDVKRRALSGVFLDPDNANIGSALNFLDGAIDRSVIDKNNFVIDTGERSPQLRLQDRHVLFFIEERNDYGNLRRFL